MQLKMPRSVDTILTHDVIKPYSADDTEQYILGGILKDYCIA